MGKAALMKHSNGKLHKKNIEQLKSTLKFFQPRKITATATSTSDRFPSTSSGSGESADQVVIVDSSPPASSPITECFHLGSSLESEIIWALKCIKSGYSDNSVDDFGAVLQAICPDSKIAKDFKVGRHKLGYLVNHGLYPYFKDLLKDEVMKSPFITVLFDESLNKTTKESEMDLIVRYWDVVERKVMVHYWHSHRSF